MQDNRVKSNQTNERKNSLFNVQHAIQKIIIHIANTRGRTCSCKLTSELICIKNKCFGKKNVSNY